MNQPLNAAIHTGLGNLFCFHAACDFAAAEPPSHGNSRPNPFFARASVSSATFCRAASPTSSETNPPYVQTFQGGLAWHGWWDDHGARSAGQALDAVVAAHKPSPRVLPRAAFLCVPAREPRNCLPPVNITAVPNGKLHAPYFMQWSLGLEHQFGQAASVHAQYVGTRAVNQPYLTQVNGYQTVCEGALLLFPIYGRPILVSRLSRNFQLVPTATTMGYNSLPSSASVTVLWDK